MVSQVGLSAVTANALPTLNNSSTALPSGTSASLFSNSSLPANSYDNDIMMSGINFGQLTTPINTQEVQNNNPVQTSNQAQTQTSVPSEQTQQTVLSFTQNKNIPQSEQSGIIPEISNLIATESAQEEPKSSNIAKILGATAGLLAPLAGKVVGLFKGGSFKSLFKLKELAVTCPILGMVGLGVGMLVDSCIDSQKSKQQSNTPTQEQNQKQIIQNFFNQQQAA